MNLKENYKQEVKMLNKSSGIFGQKKSPRPDDGCKIKIKQKGDTKTIEFSGQCSKEQLEMAKTNLGADNIEKSLE